MIIDFSYTHCSFTSSFSIIHLLYQSFHQFTCFHHRYKYSIITLRRFRIHFCYNTEGKNHNVVFKCIGSCITEGKSPTSGLPVCLRGSLLFLGIQYTGTTGYQLVEYLPLSLCCSYCSYDIGVSYTLSSPIV